MTTARRTTLVRHLSLNFGYEADVDPAVLASAILEAIEPALVDEMGIIMVEAQTSDRGTITIYAPLDRVVTEESDERVATDPPSTPSSEDNGGHCLNCCPAEGCVDCFDLDKQCDNCRQPNVGP